MKYLKLFENYKKTSVEDTTNNLKDICQELNDNYIRTECYYNNPYVVDSKYQPGFMTVGMEKMESENQYLDALSWGEISETIDRIIDYMKSENWKLSSLLIDGDNLINPEQWIENLRNKEHYSFTGLTINFIEN